MFWKSPWKTCKILIPATGILIKKRVKFLVKVQNKINFTQKVKACLSN